MWFEQAVESNPDALFALDDDLTIRFINRAGLKLFGASGEQALHRPVSQLLPGLDIAAMRAAFRQYVPYEADILLPSATLSHLYAVATPAGPAIWLKDLALHQQISDLSSQSAAVLDSVHDALIVADGTGRVATVNADARKLFGLESGDAVARAREEFDVLDLDGQLLPLDQWPLARALRGETLREVELQIRRKGQPPWIALCNSGVFRDASGKVEMAAVGIRDLTAQRAAEQALRRSEDQRLLAIDAAGLGTWVWNVRDGSITWSDRCYAIFGVPQGDPIDVHRFWSLVHPDDRAATQRVSQDSLERSVDYGAEYRVLWPDGSVHWVHAWGRAHRNENGQPLRVQGVVAGMDARRAAEQEWKQTSGTLRAIVDCSPVAIVTTDARGRIVLWNPAAERILGFRREDMRGRESPIDFEPGVEIHDRECQVTRADGAGIELLCSVAPMRDPAGELAGHVIMFSDVTERFRINRQMEHSQRIESLGVLAGGVAHDFNNLLTGILGNASLCLYLLEDNAEATAVLKDLVRAGERAAGLTRQLLSYAGKGRFVVSRLNLSELAREMTGLARGSIQNKRVKLHLALALDMPAVEADASQLQQVILNLVINGAEAVPPRENGAVHIITQTQVLTESDEQDWVTSEVLPPGRYAVLEVRDNGAGMDEATRARIFEPFFSTKFTGRGLGLSAAVGIVRQHKGALSVHSEPGKGSSFRVFLPALEEPAPPEDQSVPEEDLQGAGLVLVVDDEETVRTTAQRALEHWNYRVVLAEHGQAAVEVFPEIADRLRAVILDLTMPVMGGEETLVHFRRIRKDVPVILISGYSESEAMRRMRGKGVAAFLQKPFTADQLAKKLRDVLPQVVGAGAI